MGLKIQKKKFLEETEKYIQSLFENEGSGHDWWHIYRVRNMSIKIADSEGGNMFIIEMAALLHDLDDWKLNDNSCVSKTNDWLNNLGIFETDKIEILNCIEQVSFKGAGVETKANSIEGKIVQDADRLDAIGAIGIARTFAYGGNKGRLIYHPGIQPELHNNFEDYKKTTGPTINHFYEKLLLLKDRLNTKTAKTIAVSRHLFLKNFLNQFFGEWDCKI